VEGEKWCTGLDMMLRRTPRWNWVRHQMYGRSSGCTRKNVPSGIAIQGPLDLNENPYAEVVSTSILITLRFLQPRVTSSPSSYCIRILGGAVPKILVADPAVSVNCIYSQ
jgi:hypothetical protein